MTADRVYRPALGEDAARAELEAGAGTQFDARRGRGFLARARRGPRPPAAPRGLGRWRHAASGAASDGLPQRGAAGGMVRERTPP